MNFQSVFSKKFGSLIHLTAESAWMVRTLCGSTITGGHRGGADKPTCERCIKSAEGRALREAKRKGRAA